MMIQSYHQKLGSDDSDIDTIRSDLNLGRRNHGVIFSTIIYEYLTDLIMENLVNESGNISYNLPRLASIKITSGEGGKQNVEEIYYIKTKGYGQTPILEITSATTRPYSGAETMTLSRRVWVIGRKGLKFLG
ncbi:hypothetical protein ACU8KH_00030 [Lachancea thermotolerans]